MNKIESSSVDIVIGDLNRTANLKNNDAVQEEAKTIEKIAKLQRKKKIN